MKVEFTNSGAAGQNHSRLVVESKADTNYRYIKLTISGHTPDICLDKEQVEHLLEVLDAETEGLTVVSIAKWT